MGWVVAKPIKIKRDDVYVDLLPGDACPEAANWPNLKAWERTKYVKFVKDDEHQKDDEGEQTPENFVPSKDSKYTVRELRKFTKEQMVTLANAYGLSGAEELKRDAIVELIKEAQGG